MKTRRSIAAIAPDGAVVGDGGAVPRSPACCDVDKLGSSSSHTRHSSPNSPRIWTAHQPTSLNSGESSYQHFTTRRVSEGPYGT
ncbi:hypothetical protein RISK_002861 [Rhodopirellula islandica]|uniref:Uncharacterized protein n=1 Tax=Rhodopirellula islandica TaxID=595434 RepID=A0A0J1EHS3_RHOIS|nr:hypothetical protein RISK_002861 [Rhodopirellula islandica]